MIKQEESPPEKNGLYLLAPHLSTIWHTLDRNVNPRFDFSL